MRRWLSTRTIEISLRSRGRAALFLFAVCLPATVLALAIFRSAGSQTLGESLRPAWLQAGLRLDPDQATLYHRLGMIRFYSTDRPDNVGGLELLRRAVQMEPNAAPCWRDLASACAAAGDATCADHAFARAAALNPMAPGLHWIIGNYDLELNRTDAALTEFRRLLGMDADYSRSVFHLCLRVMPDDEIVWNKVAKGNRNFRVGLEWVNTLAVEGRLDDAYRAWREEVENLRLHRAVAGKVSYQDVSPFVDDLVQLRRGGEAQAVWSDLCRLGLVQTAGLASRHGNLVFNGGFERVPLNSGLDWRLPPSPHVMVGREHGVGPQQTSSLRIDFTPPGNNADEPAYQYVPVEPGQTYILTAQVRSDGITSRSGPRLRVADLFCSSCLPVSTPAVTGTNPWRRVSVRFSTGPQTSLVKVSVWRPRSRAFPFDISGTFWFRSVALEPLRSIPGASLSAIQPDPSSILPSRAGAGRQ
ncbi:MAG: hypothetical protein ACRD3T_08340 [Terriglobia bacterium]